jgi:hypothetical protein
VTLILDSLPADPHERRATLDALFTRRLADAEPTADGRWRVDVRPFDKAEMHVDPKLSDGLAWWAPHTRLADVPFAVRREGRSQLSLEDAWTAFSWSHWLRACGADSMTILHVDDHDDLMAPLLTRHTSARGWSDLVTGARVCLTSPDSVAAAVTSSAIGVAGFFTPFVHDVPAGEVRHLCTSWHARERTQTLGIAPEYHAHDPVFRDACRPAVRLTGDAAPWTYRATSDPDVWTRNLPEGPLLLHVDFDYFCNRFNGDSDWVLNPPENDVTPDAVAERVDAVVTALGAAGAAGRIADVCGALSPGFFPAELWASTVARLAEGLGRLGVEVPAWQ